MILLMVFGISTLGHIYSDTIASPQIRILDVAAKASETQLIPHTVEYRSPFHPYAQQQNRLDHSVGPLKSYVIYDDYPLKIFKEWKANPSSDFPAPAQNYLDFGRQPNADLPSDFYGHYVLPPPKPTLAYSSVYSNVIKVFDGSLASLDRNRFESDRYVKPYRESWWKSQPSIGHDLLRPQDIHRRQPYHNLKLPDNFPNIFSPNSKFHFSSFDERLPQPPQYFHSREGLYNTHTVNYNKEGEGNPDDVEILGEGPGQKEKRKPFLCSFIKVNQRQFPENGAPCGRSEDELPIALPEYPDYSGLPDHKIPVEHRRQHFLVKRIKRSETNGSYGGRKKREVGFGYGYSGWASPFGYEGGYDGYYPNREGYYRGFGNSYGSNYYGNNNRNRNQGYRNSYYSGSRYDEYDDDYQNNDDSNSRGLAGYLTNSGRRYKSRRNNNDDDDDDDDDNDDDNNNRDNNSDQEMERMNNNRRDANDRRNNDDSRDRRRNNNNNNNNNNSNNNNGNNNNDNNDNDDYRDNRRNNNRNNNRRYNNNNNNNNNNSRRNYNDRYDYNNNNDRYDYNNNRNRYYSNNGYGSYGSSYGGYGNGGYGSSYRNNGYGYGGYGNGFGSF